MENFNDSKALAIEIAKILDLSLIHISDALRDIIAEEMTPEAEMDLSGKPAVILVIGVNGVGKTTSIAKLADFYTRQRCV